MSRAICQVRDMLGESLQASPAAASGSGPAIQGDPRS